MRVPGNRFRAGEVQRGGATPIFSERGGGEIASIPTTGKTTAPHGRQCPPTVRLLPALLPQQELEGIQRERAGEAFLAENVGGEGAFAALERANLLTECKEFAFHRAAPETGRVPGSEGV